MGSQSMPGTWATEASQHAERELDAAIDNAAAQMRHSDEVIAKANANEKPASEEQIEQLRAYVTGPGRTPQWDTVVARIAVGEFTWRDIAEGNLVFDQGVDAALASLPTVSLTESAEPTEGAAETAGRRQPESMDDDDDYFVGFHPFD